MSPRWLSSRRVSANWSRAGVAAWLSLPFACSVYDAADLGGWGEAAGNGGAPPPNNVAGRSPNTGGAGAGAGGGAGTGSPGGSAGAPSAGAAGRGGSAPVGGGPSSGTASEGGAPEPPGGAGEGGGGAGEPSDSGLVALYTCDGASEDLLADASERGNAARLVNGKADVPPGFGFVDGVVGKALRLSSSSQSHVQLPRGIVSRFREVTIATWVKLASSTAFQRIFDFGTSTDTFMYLSSAGSTGLLRFRISSASPNRNQALEGGKGLPLGTWAHVAVTVSDDGIALYQNGAQIAQQAPAVLRPTELGDTTNNFIGRSPFATDPYLDAEIDEFRVYGRALSASEIADLATLPGQ